MPPAGLPFDATDRLWGLDFEDCQASKQHLFQVWVLPQSAIPMSHSPEVAGAVASSSYRLTKRRRDPKTLVLARCGPGTRQRVEQRGGLRVPRRSRPVVPLHDGEEDRLGDGADGARVAHVRQARHLVRRHLWLSHHLGARWWTYAGGRGALRNRLYLGEHSGRWLRSDWYLCGQGGGPLRCYVRPGNHGGVMPGAVGQEDRGGRELLVRSAPDGAVQEPSHVWTDWESPAHGISCRGGELQSEADVGGDGVGVDHQDGAVQ